MRNGSFSVRSISWKDTTLVNICDLDLVGRTVSDGKLKMHISKDYFGGGLAGEGEVLELMRNSSIISLAGKRSVDIALRNKLAAGEAVRIIGDVPFLMIYKFFY